MKIEELVKTAIKNIQKGKGLLDHGHDGRIYSVTDEVVLKLHTGSHHGSPRIGAQYEFGLGRELHQQGVQVPQYLGLFGPVSLLHQESWGVLMERIYGLEPAALASSMHLEALRQYKQQKELIDRLGYTVKDSKNMYQNTMFDPKQQKLYLFDLVRWERK